MNGRETPQNDTDQQCEHCGLWFHRRGIAAHERNCSLKGSDHSIIPVESGSDPTGSSPPTPSDGAGEGANPSDGLGLGGPPDVEQDATGSDDPSDVADDDVTCPECDAPGDVDPDALDDGDEVVCTDCGARLVWREGATA